MRSSAARRWELDETGLKEVVRRLVDRLGPQKVVLFGSRASGNARPDSDVDLLIIMRSGLPRFKRAVPAYRALTGILIPKDVVVYTPEEVDEWSEVPEAFVTTALRTGRVLYEKK